MVTVDEAIIAKYDNSGKHFEILVDPIMAYELKEGKSISVQNMLAVNDIFVDSKKGDKANSSDIESVFKTVDIFKVAEEIIKKGEVQLTTDFRNKKIEDKKKQIADFISKNAVNPQTKVPHPLDRILNSMAQAKTHIDPFKSTESQIEDVMNALRPIIPISMEQATIIVDVPAQYAGSAYGTIKNLGEMKDQQWKNDGGLFVKLTFPAGLKENIFRKINSVTGGNAIIKEE